MTQPIVIEGAPVLRETSKEVLESEFGTEPIKKLVKDMSDSLRTTDHGVAIAAPQIGVAKRVFVVRGNVLTGKERSNTEDLDVEFINPILTRVSRKKERFDEGCLSVPNKYGTIVRSRQVTIKAYTLDGVEFEMCGEGLIAEIFQHEIEHLDGILFIDNAYDVYTHEPKESKDA